MILSDALILPVSQL